MAAIWNIFYNYIFSQVNWNTLFLLFGLMAVVAGFQSLGYIDRFSTFLIGKSGNLRGLSLCLVFLSYFMSMLVTNDVSLIILVPFTIELFERTENSDKIILVVVLETIAANIGGMLTPIGNPQNVYLYQHYEMNLSEFFFTLLPFGALAFVILFATICFRVEKKTIGVSCKADMYEFENDNRCFQTIMFSLLFILCLLSVLRIIPNVVSFGVACIVMLICNRKLFKMINWELLKKFVILFIIVGNVAAIPVIKEYLSTLVSGHEFWCGVLISQVVSNVPGAILLSGFTTNGLQLLLGVNVGGLGTLIASMASMISLDYYGKSKGHDNKRYIGVFTLANVLCLIAMIALYLIIYVVM